MSLVVTATDTGVGKTLVSALLLTRYRSLRPVYWKPLATGGAAAGDSRTIASLAPAETRILPEACLFETPVSPHRAAQLEGRPIVSEELRRAFGALPREVPAIVEGIGGLLVPLDSAGWLLADLLQEVALPLLVVASTRVGTINHTLLTLEAARRRGLAVAGVVLTGDHDSAGNREAIERFGAVEVIDVVPPLGAVSRESVARAAAAFDTAGRLEARLKPRSEMEHRS